MWTLNGDQTVTCPMITRPGRQRTERIAHLAPTSRAAPRRARASEHEARRATARRIANLTLVAVGAISYGAALATTAMIRALELLPARYQQPILFWPVFAVPAFLLGIRFLRACGRRAARRGAVTAPIAAAPAMPTLT